MFTFGAALNWISAGTGARLTRLRKFTAGTTGRE